MNVRLSGERRSRERHGDGGALEPCERCESHWGVRRIETVDGAGDDEEVNVEAEVSLSTEDLERLVSEWLARVGGIAMPVRRVARWRWVIGESGPRLEMAVERVGNVVSIGHRSEVGG